jgi:hypothetical protein
MIGAGGTRRAAVMEATRRQTVRRRVETTPRTRIHSEVCAGCGSEIEGGAVLRGGLLYCSFECAGYAAARVPGLYLG